MLFRSFNKDPKIQKFVADLIEIQLEEKTNTRPAITLKPIQRIDKPSSEGLRGLMGSPVGMLLLLLIYAANIYIAFEISVYRNYHPALVAGLAAVLPVLAPLVFICIPTRIPPTEEEYDPNAPPEQTPTLAVKSSRPTPEAEQKAAASAETVYQKGRVS